MKPKPNKTKAVLARLPQWLYERLKREAKEQHRAMGAQVAWALAKLYGDEP